MRIFQAIIVVILLLQAPSAIAAGWLIFDVAGDVQLKHGRDTTSLTASKHLLTEVAGGDTITTLKNGKITLVSLATNDAFEIGANAVVAIGEQELKASKGAFKQQKGYALPKKKPVAMAGVVMRGDPHQECLQISRGGNTATHLLTPSLSWQNLCDGNPVHLSLFSDRGLVFEQEVREGVLTVPPGTLHYGERYVWLLETLKRDQVAAAAFKVLGAVEAAAVAQLLGKPTTGLADELSKLFYLRELGVNEAADERQTLLSRDYPQIDFAAVLNR